MTSDKNALEIESLNLDDLDVEELEHRVELATTSIGVECYINCGCDGTLTVTPLPPEPPPPEPEPEPEY